MLLLPLPLLLLLLALPSSPASPSSETLLPLPRAHQRLSGVHLPASASRAEPGGDASAGLLHRGRPGGRPRSRLAVLRLQHAVVPAPQPAAAASPLPLAALRPASAETRPEKTPRPRPTLRPARPGLHQDDSGRASTYQTAGRLSVANQTSVFNETLIVTIFRDRIFFPVCSIVVRPHT